MISLAVVGSLDPRMITILNGCKIRMTSRMTPSVRWLLPMRCFKAVTSEKASMTGAVDTPTPWEVMVAGLLNGCKATTQSHTIVSAMEQL